MVAVLVIYMLNGSFGTISGSLTLDRLCNAQLDFTCNIILNELQRAQSLFSIMNLNFSTTLTLNTDRLLVLIS